MSKLNWELIGQLSSLITLFLFVIYIIGRLWTINIKRKLNYEHFKMLNVDEENKICNFIDPNKLCDLGEDELNIFSSDLHINKFKIYEIEYINGRYEKWVLKSKVPRYIYKNLNANESLYIKMNTPCGGPSKYLIEYIRYDYVKVSYIPSYNGFSEDVSKYKFKSKMTLRGYLYYLFN